MISTRSAGLLIDTVVCLTLAKWETVSGRFGGYLIERAREIRWRAPVRTPPGIAEMGAHIEAGPIVGLDDRGLPRRLYRHRHFRGHGRSSSQKRRRPCHARQLHDGRTADDSETLSTTSHGGRSGPLDSSPLSPQRKTAPCARPARRKDDVVQAGLLARGSSSFSAFPGFAVQSPVATWRRTRRRQLRGQLRI